MIGLPRPSSPMMKSQYFSFFRPAYGAAVMRFGQRINVFPMNRENDERDDEIPPSPKPSAQIRSPFLSVVSPFFNPSSWREVVLSAIASKNNPGFICFAAKNGSNADN